MDFLIDNCMGTPLGLALFGAHYLYFALLAWALLCLRIGLRRMSRAEWLAFAVFATFLVLEAVQLAVDTSFFKHELWGLPRYFGVFGPLVWLWLAKGLSDAWSLPENPKVRWTVRALIVCALGYVFVCENVAQVSKALLHGNGREAMVAAQNIAPTIRADYKGPRRQAEATYVGNEYFQPVRPVVFGNFAAAAWAVRGQSEGANQTITSRGLCGKSRCPYAPDYVFLCLGREGDKDFEVDLDETKYEFVKGVKGMKTVWGLFRRK